MGSQSFEVTWNVTIIQPHIVVAMKKAGTLADKLNIVVDHQLLLSESVGPFKFKGNKPIQIDGETVEVAWQWRIGSDYPTFITLSYQDRIVAAYPTGLGIVLPTASGNAALAAEIIDSQQSRPPISQLMQARLEAQLRNGASWFYWIAGLSIVNSLVMWFEGGMQFLAGLAITQLIDAIIYGIAEGIGAQGNVMVTLIALIFDIIVAGICALFGFLAVRKHQWIFILGMVLYGIDALILLAFQDFLSFAFHLYALYGLFSGLKALRQLLKLQGAGKPATAGVEPSL